MAGACELIATGLQQEDNHLHAQQENNWAISQVDLTDAFDSVKRRLVLAEVAKTCPEAYNWFESCSVVAHFIAETRFCAAPPVCNKVTCGPAGFALALQPPVESLQLIRPQQIWYLDDGHILGSLPQLHAAAMEIQRQGTLMGMQLNPEKKCRL